MKETDCRHMFELSQVVTEPSHDGSTSAPQFYNQFGIVVCVKCGEVRKNKI